MTLIEEIFQELWAMEINYKGTRVNMFGIPKFLTRKRSVSSTLSRLKNQDYVSHKDKVWKITHKGKDYYKNKFLLFPHFKSPFKKSAPKNMIFMFDIPETKRSYRDWMRRELQNFEYILVQRSVWVGPSPLPKKFLDHLKNSGLENYLQTFKLSKGYSASRVRLHY